MLRHMSVFKWLPLIVANVLVGKSTIELMVTDALLPAL